MDIFTKGCDYTEENATFKTYGINVDRWENKIEVYGDEELRDQLIDLLNKTALTD